MDINEELRRIGETPTTAEELADARRFEAHLEQIIAGQKVDTRNDPASKTATLLMNHVQILLARGNRLVLDELGSELPQYEFQAEVGIGGMGIVFRARDIAFDIPVAIKIIRPDFANDPEFLARFKRELRVMVNLNHHNIVRPIGFGRVKDLFYLTMEHIEGGTLRDRLEDGLLPLEEALRIAADLCSALQHAHEKGIVHRDVKPENILFDGKQVKLTDFGLARILGDAYSTSIGRTIGTIDYVADEQRKNAAAADARSDIYSFGIVLYEMLTGERPGRDYVPVSQKLTLDPKVGEALDQIIRRCLKQCPEDRFNNADEVRLRIEAVRNPPVVIPPPPSGVPWRPILAMALSAVIAVLVWMVVPKAEREEGILRWGGDAMGGAPFIYEERGKLKGFEVELIETIAARIKMKPQFVQTKWDMLPQALRRGDVDVVFNGYAWSAARDREMNSTIPYGVVSMRLIVRKDDPDRNAVRDWGDLRLPGPNGQRRVGTLKTSASEKHLIDHYAAAVEIETPGSGTVEALLSVQNGRLDASVQDEFTAKYYLKHDFRTLTIVGGPVDPTPFVAFTHRSNPELRDRINATLREMMRDHTLKQIYQSYDLWDDSMKQKLEDLARDWPPHDEEVVESIWPALGTLVQAASVTVQLALIAMPLAMLVGLVVAIGRLYGPFWLRVPLAGYVECLRGTPLLLQLAALYFLLPELGIFLPAFWASVIGLAINYSAYESEHYRAGILAVSRGQMEAALTLGMTRWTALRHIILPQALRTVVPSVTNDFIALFKDTAVCSVVAVFELTGQYQRLAVAEPQRIFTYAMLAAVLYLFMSYPLSLLARRFERRPHPPVN